MRITDIHVDGFGTLSHVSVEGLQPGLNALQTADATQRSMVLEFLRGVFGGFADARQAKLIPAQGVTVSGGSVGVEWGSRRLAIIRHGRPDGSDTLAINVRQGRAEEAQALRKHLETIDSQRLRGLFTAGCDNTCSVGAILDVARLDGIALSPTQADGEELEYQRNELRRRRHDLLRGPRQEGRLAALVAIRDAGRLDCERRDDWLRTRLVGLIETSERLGKEIDLLEIELVRRHEDWQAAIADLREVEERLAGRKLETIVDVEYVLESRPPAPSFAVDKVAEIDRQIERLRLVLKDLAASRLQATLGAVDVMGADSIGQHESFRRQRETLRVIEQQVQALASSTHGEPAFSERSASAIDELRRRVELNCQELSRQQSAQVFQQYQSERQSIDDCESHLIRQVNRLRHEREQALDRAAAPERSRLMHPASFERRHCECAEHTSTTRDACPPTTTRTVAVERVREVSTAREGDRIRRDRLLAEVGRRWIDWQSSMQRRCLLERELLDLKADEERCRNDGVLRELKSTLALAEDELSQAQKSWQALLTAEASLREAEQQWDGAESGRILKDASSYLSLLTDGQARGVRINPTQNEVEFDSDGIVADQSSSELQVPRQLAALALRLALVDEYSRRGIDFPLILEDATFRAGADPIGATARVLSRIASQGRQVIVLSNQMSVVDAMRSVDASVCVLPGAVAGHLKKNAADSEPHAETILRLGPVQFDLDVEVRNAESPDVLTIGHPVEDVEEAQSNDRRRVRPGSPIEVIPSIDIESATRLRHAGVFTVRDLLELDSATQTSLIQIAPGDLSTWRAESQLLLEISELQAPDAQLLVACGVFTRRELAGWECGGLHQRIQRFRGSAPPVWHVWIQKRQTWPQEAEVQRWIDAARGIEAGEPIDRPPASDRSSFSEAGPRPEARQGKTRRRRSRSSRRSEPVARGEFLQSSETKFHLTLESPIIDAPAIGPKSARVLQRAGVATVAHLLSRLPKELADCIADSKVDATCIDDWQCQSRLMCQVAGLRGHDAQLLVACGIRSAEAVASLTAGELLGRVSRIAGSKAGQRILRSSSPPDLNDAAAWVGAASQSLRRKAA